MIIHQRVWATLNSNFSFNSNCDFNFNYNSSSDFNFNSNFSFASNFSTELQLQPPSPKSKPRHVRIATHAINSQKKKKPKAISNLCKIVVTSWHRDGRRETRCFFFAGLSINQ